MRLAFMHERLRASQQNRRGMAEKAQRRRYFSGIACFEQRAVKRDVLRRFAQTAVDYTPRISHRQVQIVHALRRAMQFKLAALLDGRLRLLLPALREKRFERTFLPGIARHVIVELDERFDRSS